MAWIVGFEGTVATGATTGFTAGMDGIGTDLTGSGFTGVGAGRVSDAANPMPPSIRQINSDPTATRGRNGRMVTTVLRTNNSGLLTDIHTQETITGPTGFAHGFLRTRSQLVSTVLLAVTILN